MSNSAPIPIASLRTLGANLHRPECVLPMPSGDVYVPEWPGGVTVVRADGRQQTWLARNAAIDLRPNGIALTQDGGFLLANLGDDGGVWRLDRSGGLFPLVTEVDGIALPPANFVTVDEDGRVWLSVSTRRQPRHQAWRRDVADGFVVVQDDAGARIVAEGLHYTNEVRVDPSRQWLYVVETFGRRVRRFPIRRGAALGRPEVVYAEDAAFFPDGFTFDDRGGLWITSLITNRLLQLEGNHRQVVLEDVNERFARAADEAFATGSMRPEHLGPIPGTTLQQLTSVAFGGPDHKTVSLGTLHGSTIYQFRSEVPGARMSHWQFQAP
jgi:sugar lactone lactonase YvrE